MFLSPVFPYLNRLLNVIDLSLKRGVNRLNFCCDFVDCCHHFFVKTGNENDNLFAEKTS